MARKLDAPGVYCILNLASGRAYVGSSVGVLNRFTTHRWQLRSGRHFNARLQRDWTESGEAAFDLFVIELCDKDQRAAREQVWADRLAAFEYGYNKGDCCLKIMFPRTRAKLSAAMRGKNTWTKGVPRPQEVRDRIGLSLRGLKRSDASRKRLCASKLGDKNPMSKLSNAQWDAVREEYLTMLQGGVGKATASRVLGARLGLHPNAIYYKYIKHKARYETI